MFGWWLMLKVFSSGCTAMTGVEAVSNGVTAFREPTRKNAKTTLTIIIALLAILLAGIALLCRAYGIAATDPGKPGYESVLSMLTRAVMGQGWFYYLTIGSVLLVLALSANTAFADFPRLTRAIALDNYMPHVFLIRGRRLLYSWGIYVLVALTALLLILFRRCDGPVDPAVRHRRIHGFHVVASRDGGALEAYGRLTGAHHREWPGRSGDRHHDTGGAGCQVR
jgi:amino acid transporter